MFVLNNGGVQVLSLMWQLCDISSGRQTNLSHPVPKVVSILNNYFIFWY